MSNYRKNNKSWSKEDKITAAVLIGTFVLVSALILAQ